MRLARRATGRDGHRLLRGRVPRPHGGRDVGRGPGEVPRARQARTSPATASSRSATSPRSSAPSTSSVAAVLIEPIQSLAGVIDGVPASTSRVCASSATSAGAKLIYDEVQTGFGRTGTFFYAGRHGVVPDLVALAKGIGSGFPMGAVLVSDGDRGAGQARGLRHDLRRRPARLRRRARRRCGSSARRASWRTSARVEALAEGLSGIAAVREVRGEGFLLGIVLDRPGKPVREALLERGFLVGGSDLPDVLRLLPPLVLTAEEIDAFPRQHSGGGPVRHFLTTQGLTHERIRGAARARRGVPRRGVEPGPRADGTWGSSSSTRRCGPASRWRSPSRSSAACRSRSPSAARPGRWSTRTAS